MAVAIVFSRAQLGVSAPPVTVEVHLSGGLPGLSIVGLPETAVKESKDRVRSALLNCQFEFPLRRITVNLAPADLPKEGGRFDLAIALGVLAASGQLPYSALEAVEFIGELALTGELRAVKGVIPVALATRKAGRELVLPLASAAEAAMVSEVRILGAQSLLQVCAHLRGEELLTAITAAVSTPSCDYDVDLSDVKDQHHAKRALEIAAAGAHNLLMTGPPGSGKSMLARRLPTLLPVMSDLEAVETAAVASVSQNGFDAGAWKIRPFRAPHHTASAVALVGGGSHPRPGEISLAHNGVLFLDELPEFARAVLEVLREPLESGSITVSRAARQADFPAKFQLVAAMNPCPCGYLGDSSGRCGCSAEAVRRYRAKISGPLLDRIDLHIHVPPVPQQALMDPNPKVALESSALVRGRVELARQRQLRLRGKPNAQMDVREIEAHCLLSDNDKQLLVEAMTRLQLSARAMHRVLKVARTIADLDGAEDVATPHLAEAITLRRPSTTAT